MDPAYLKKQAQNRVLMLSIIEYYPALNSLGAKLINEND